MIRWVAGAGFGLVLAIAALAAIVLAKPPDLSRLADLSVSVRGNNGAIMQVRLNSEGIWREPARLAKIDPRLVESLIAYEDQRFYSHHGVDPFALLRATLSYISAGRVVSGASTITMQVARLLDPGLRDRSIATKLRQIIAALRLEVHLSKREILEAYFTLAPYGGNIEGVNAAAWTWFGKSPELLTEGETALLVAPPAIPGATAPRSESRRGPVPQERM